MLASLFWIQVEISSFFDDFKREGCLNCTSFLWCCFVSAPCWAWHKNRWKFRATNRYKPSEGFLGFVDSTSGCLWKEFEGFFSSFRLLSNLFFWTNMHAEFQNTLSSYSYFGACQQVVAAINIISTLDASFCWHLPHQTMRSNVKHAQIGCALSHLYIRQFASDGGWKEGQSQPSFWF